MSRRVVYIAHPLSGDWAANIASAKRYVISAVRLGYAPVAPYIEIDGLLDDDSPEDRAAGIECDLAILPRCDELWLCGPRLSAGMREEMRVAVEHGIFVRYLPES
jgi:hypothetical protein